MGRPAAAVQLPAALPRLVALAWPRRGHRTALTLLQGLAIGRGLVAFGEALAGHSGAAGELVQICMRRFAPAGRVPALSSRLGAAPVGCGAAAGAAGAALPRVAALAWPRGGHGSERAPGARWVLPSWIALAFCRVGFSRTRKGNRYRIGLSIHYILFHKDKVNALS